MKKVLILAYDFPPYVSVGGLRPYNWYRHFKEFGIEPIIITRQWGNTYGNSLDYVAESSSKQLIVESTEFGTILRTPYRPNLSNRLLIKYGDKRYRFLRKVITGFYEIVQFFVPVGSKIELYKAAESYLKKSKVDLMIATGEPYILFRYSSILSKKYRIPWVADYRDPWSQNIHIQSNTLLRIFSYHLERRHVSGASLITTANESFQFGLTKLFPSKRIEVIQNGYSETTVGSAKSVRQDSEQLSIAFAGSIYQWHPIDSFLNVCCSFVKKRGENAIKLKFFGVNSRFDICDVVGNKYPELKSVVEIFPSLTEEEVGIQLSKSNCFLLFNDYSIVGTKIFSYMGLKRKIIFCFEKDRGSERLKQLYFHNVIDSKTAQDFQARILRQTNSGVIVQDSDHLFAVLEELYFEFHETKQIACHSVGVEKYSRKIQVKQLAELSKTL